jgi:hypothetical protein
VKLIARARRWFDDLVSRKAPSMADIRRHEKLTKPYVSRVVRFALLAPVPPENLIQDDARMGVW